MLINDNLYTGLLKKHLKPTEGQIGKDQINDNDTNY